MYKGGKYYVENSFAYWPEMTMDSEDKTEETPANLWVYGTFSATGRAHEQTFAYEIFTLPHKNRRTSFLVNGLVTEKLATENVLVWTRLYPDLDWGDRVD